MRRVIGVEEAHELLARLAVLERRVEALERNASTHLLLGEITDPGASDANAVRVYADDNGAGKTRIMARFASGAAQQLAIQP